jgi:nucleotidyltransferase AbiEii toxin of type IV toxin-antitoxin system
MMLTPSRAQPAARKGEATWHPCHPQTVDRDEILRVLRAFQEAGLNYVLIGATAMGLHGLVRATEDVDLFIQATPENVERLRLALRSAYWGDPHIDEITADDLLGEYPAVRYYPPSGDVYFDIMTRLGEGSRYETVDAETKEVSGIRVRVATPLALYRLKKDTVRAKDRDDAAAIRARVGLNDDVGGDRPVQRFTSGEAMNAAPARGRESDFDAFLRHCARYWALAPRTYPRGVFKFRSIQEAQEARERPTEPPFETRCRN